MGIVLVTKCIIITKHANVLVNYNMFALRMRFSCQEWSRLRSKQPNRISDYIVIRFICALRNHFLKMASLQKIYGCVPGKTIHSQAKYIIMDYCDQEAKKFRAWLVYPKAILVSCLCYGATLSFFVVGVIHNSVYSFVVNSMARGYHQYKEIWLNPFVGEELLCEWKVGNSHDPLAVAI